MSRTLGVTIAAALALAAPARAEVIGYGEQPHAVVDGAGVTHVVWKQSAADGASSAIGYCRIPAGQLRCDATFAEHLPFGDAYGAAAPRVYLAAGARVVLVSGSRGAPPDGREGGDRTIIWSSSDRGENWDGPYVTGNLRPDASIITRDGQSIIVMARSADGSRVELQPVPAEQPWVISDSRASLPSGGLPVTLDIGLDGAAPLAVWDGRFTRHLGGDARATESWSAPAAHGATGIEPSLAGGASGLFLVDRSDGGLRIQRYDGGWGPGADPTCRDEAGSGGGGLGAASAQQDAEGRLHLAYLRHTGSTHQLRYVSSPDGRSFSSPVTLSEGTHLEMEVAMGGGMVLWRRNGDIPEVHAVRLPATPPAPAECAPPQTSTPPPPPPPPPAPPAAPPAAPRPPVLGRLALKRARLGFTLDRAARVTVSIHRRATCRARKRCRPWTRIRRFTVAGRAGRNSIALTRAQLPGRPGRYRLRAVPAAAGMTGSPATIAYRIPKR